MEEPKKTKETQKNRLQHNPFLRFTGIAFQMGITIFLGAYAGKYLDQKYQLENKWFTIILTLTGVAVALYNVLKQVNRINDDE